MSDCIAIIPARGGSKRVPKKNIKLFKGKPIISYVIKAALKSKCFKKIVVSTDSEEIAKISKKYGAEILFKRPINISKDSAGTRPVINHAINFLDKLKIKFEYICQLYPTGVMVDHKKLVNAFKLIKARNYNFVFGATEYQYPIQRSFKINRTNKIKILFPKYKNKNSNKLEKIYHDAGQFYFGHKNSFLKYKSMFSKNSFPVIIRKSEAWDIDDPEDWLIAESLYKIKYK